MQRDIIIPHLFLKRPAFFLYICLLSSVVEQLTRNEQVVGSTPMGGSGGQCGSSSGVEHQLPKLRVEGSNPFSRSNKKARKRGFCYSDCPTLIYQREGRINNKRTPRQWRFLFDCVPSGESRAGGEAIPFPPDKQATTLSPSTTRLVSSAIVLNSVPSINEALFKPLLSAQLPHILLFPLLSRC